MSLQTRTEIAEAASTVEGITGHAYFVQRTEPGQAYVSVERTEYPDKFGGVRYWRLFVVGPQDLAKFERFYDEKAPAVTEALRPVLFVTSSTPNQITIPDHGSLLGFVVVGHREE